MKIQAYAAKRARDKLEYFEYDLGNIKPDEIEIDIEYCGICHSDLSMLNNDWGLTEYPIVPGHEIIGKVSEIGSMVEHLKVGQHVGIGWRARSCLVCDQCLSGNHHRCLRGEDVIVGVGVRSEAQGGSSAVVTVSKDGGAATELYSGPCLVEPRQEHFDGLKTVLDDYYGRWLEKRKS